MLTRGVESNKVTLQRVRMGGCPQAGEPSQFEHRWSLIGIFRFPFPRKEGSLRAVLVQVIRSVLTVLST